MSALLLAAALVAAHPAPPPPKGQPPTEEGPAAGAQPVPPDAGSEIPVRRDFAAAQAERGPLEGRWRLVRADGRPLYLFEFTDPGGRPDPRAANPAAPGVEGAWLTLDGHRRAMREGYLAAVRAAPGGLTILFYEGGRTTASAVSLRRARGGAWTGAITGPAGAFGVVMRRD